MKKLLTNRPDNVYWVLLFLLSALGTALIMAFTANYGVGVSTDSIIYLHAAGQILAGESIDMAYWPPLYPIILAGFSTVFNITILETARMVSAGLFGITIFLTGILYKQRLISAGFYRVLAIISVLVAVPLIPVFIMAWSEPLFIVFVTLYLVFFELYRQQRRPLYLQLFSISIALAAMTRYIGVAFILAGAVNLLLTRQLSLKAKIRDTSNFIFISAALITAWLIRNYLVLGTLTGERMQSPYSLLRNLQSVIDSTLRWYIPDINLFLVFGFLILFGYLAGRYIKKVLPYRKPNLTWQYPYIAFIMIYLVFLIASSTSSFTQLIGDRYLAPVFIPINLLVLALTFEIFQPSVDEALRRKWDLFLSIFIALLLISPVIRAGNALVHHNTVGTGFTARLWQESETLDYIMNNDLDCALYSNGADGIVFLTGKKAAPVPYKEKGAVQVATMDSIGNEWPSEERVCLVWFDNITWRNYYFTPDELLLLARLKMEIIFNDGAAYFLEKY